MNVACLYYIKPNVWTSMGSSDGDWAIISIDNVVTRVKIVRKGRGKYRIVEDTKEGKYVDRLVDASDTMQVEK
jgi:hypothetical protein